MIHQDGVAFAGMHDNSQPEEFGVLASTLILAHVNQSSIICDPPRENSE